MVPEAVRRSLSGEPDGHGGDLVVEVVAVDDEGWPHAAMISWGELAVLGSNRMRMALWPHSETTRLVGERGKATLLTVLEGAHHEIRVRVDRHAEVELAAGEKRRIFDLTVVSADSKSAPYAELTGCTTFRLKDPEVVLPRWRRTRRTLETAEGLDA